MDMNYISELLQAIFLAILPVLAAAGVRWFFKEALVQKAKLSNEHRVFLTNLVHVAVLAAEQFGLTAKAGDEYFDKREFAIDFVESRLHALGLEIDAEYLIGQIEAAVMDEFNRFKDELG